MSFRKISVRNLLVPGTFTLVYACSAVSTSQDGAATSTASQPLSQTSPIRVHQRLRTHADNTVMLQTIPDATCVLKAKDATSSDDFPHLIFRQ